MAERKSLDELEIMTPKELGVLLLDVLSDILSGLDIEYIKAIINSGADLGVKTAIYDDKTPLHLAAINNYINVIKLLVEAGVNLNAMDKWGAPPLHYVVNLGYFDPALLLIQSGALIDFKTEGDLWTPLHYAASVGEYHMLALLLEAGANPNILDRYGYTPLHYAAVNEYSDMCIRLLQAGADLEIKNIDGDTPWDCANEETKDEVPELNPNYNG